MPVRTVHLRAACLWAALWAGGAVLPAAAADDAAERQYRQEIERCRSAPAIQDRQACRREAGAARAASRAGTLGGGKDDYAVNAMRRCDRLPEADRDICRMRMRGEGRTEGSVEGGGIYRELVVPDAPARSGTPR